MTAPSPTESATLNARAVTRQAYQRLRKQALDAGDADNAQLYREIMETLEAKWRKADELHSGKRKAPPLGESSGA